MPPITVLVLAPTIREFDHFVHTRLGDKCVSYSRSRARAQTEEYVYTYVSNEQQCRGHAHGSEYMVLGGGGEFGPRKYRALDTLHGYEKAGRFKVHTAVFQKPERG